jgi:hypothetical protein
MRIGMRAIGVGCHLLGKSCPRKVPLLGASVEIHYDSIPSGSLGQG